MSPGRVNGDGGGNSGSSPGGNGGGGGANGLGVSPRNGAASGGGGVWEALMLTQPLTGDEKSLVGAEGTWSWVARTPVGNLRFRRHLVHLPFKCQEHTRTAAGRR